MSNVPLAELSSRVAAAGLGDQASGLLETLLAAQAVEKKADTSGAEYKSDTPAAETVATDLVADLLKPEEIAAIAEALHKLQQPTIEATAEQAATKALTAFKATTDAVIKAATDQGDETALKIKAAVEKFATLEQEYQTEFKALQAEIAELKGEQTAQVKGYRPSQDTEQVKEKAEVVATGPVDPVAKWSLERAQGA